MKYISYNVKKYDFNKIYSDIVGVDNLRMLHESNLNIYREVFSREEDQSTIFHKIYYDNFSSNFELLYNSFIRDIISPLYNEAIIYQKIPTFRVHFPGNIAVGEYHKDKWYRDSKWHEEVCEMNYYLPFTKTFGTNTIWVESEEDKKDFKPITAEYGECIQWDGVNLTHGNKKNISNSTRVSVDFRVIPFSKYKPSNNSSINTKTKFAIGGYYKLLNKNENN